MRTGNSGPCSPSPEHVASILIVTRWIPLLQEQHLFPRQEKKQKQSNRLVQPSLPFYLRKAIGLMQVPPAGFWPPLVSRDWPCDPHQVPGSLGRGALHLGHCLPTQTQSSINKNEGRMEVEGNNVSLGTIISVLLMRK